MGVDQLHQPAHLIVQQERGRAAAPMELHYIVAAIQRFCLHCQLAPKVLDVLGGTTVILRDDLVTAAVIADRVAEGDVDV